jgi:hypothetical protein
MAHQKKKPQAGGLRYFMSLIRKHPTFINPIIHGTTVKKSKIFALFMFMGIVFLSFINIIRFYGDVGDGIRDVFLNRTEEGVPSRFGERGNIRFILPLMKLIPKGASVYLWAPSFLEKEISNECRAYEFAYYLYPSKVFYRDDSNISQSDFVVCENAFSALFDLRLFELQILFGKSFDLRKVYSDQNIAIFAGNNLNLLSQGESKIIFGKRMSSHHFNPASFLRFWLGIFAIFFIGLPLILIGKFRTFIGVFSLPAQCVILWICGLGAFIAVFSYMMLAGCQMSFFAALSVAIFAIIALIGTFYFAAMRAGTGTGVNGKNNATKKDGNPAALPPIAKLAIVIFAAVIFSLLFLKANIKGAEDAAGQAVWGLKTKMLFEDRGFDTEYFKDDTKKYSHQDYPNGWPILLAVLSSCAGKYDDALLNNASVFIALLLFVSFIAMAMYFSSSPFLLLSAVMLLFANYYFLCVSSVLYAEPLLMLFVLWGVFFWVRYLEEGHEMNLFLNSLFFAFCMLVKNEGILLCVVNILVISAFSLKKCSSAADWKIAGVELLKRFLTLAVPFFLLLIPSAAQRYFFGAENYDFALSRIGNMDSLEIIKVFLTSVSEMLKNLFFDTRANLIFSFLIPFAIILLLRKERKGRSGASYCILLALIYIFIIVGSFIFSMRPISWHIRSLPRIMLMPELIISFAVIALAGFSNKLNS